MNYSSTLKNIIDTFVKFDIEFMLIGGGGAVAQGFNQMTQDIDLYPEDSVENNEKIIYALESLGFKLIEKEIENIIHGKDFIQFNEPIQLDLVFYPDGFNSYKEAKKYKKIIDGIPVMSIEGIIKSKESANRPKDKLILPLLKDFLNFLKNGGRKTESYNSIEENYFEVPKGYNYADNQTIERWKINLKKSLEERLEAGIGF